MKRQLVWVLVVLGLCAGCATRPASEADVLASKIARERPSNFKCEPGSLRYCEVDVDRQKHCTCVDHAELFPPR
jgi:hypothetical protein